MGEWQILMPTSALFAVPFIYGKHCKVMWRGRDIAPDPDHSMNRWACKMANEQNAITASKFGVRAPYYHYDALSGRALEIDNG